ncbi:hypothetical protein E2C01_086689 [Portunus trituberculatus]|uniref:G-protein coupled receptors family 1 profile domain-containing protein n=1 Tax=Portunus trituberculatus TaxID=210409 RepID=A0A5B7JFB6_PORTR|nr:hypothetical protein [Portunus trituberculatus]
MAKNLRTTATAFVVNLAVVELLFCVLILPMSGAQYLYLQRHLQGSLLTDTHCIFFVCVRYTLTQVELQTILAIALTRQQAGEIWEGLLMGEDECRYKIQTAKGTQAKVAIAYLRLGHTTLSAHLHCLRLSPDPFCPWCTTTHETIEHFLIQCPRLHSYRTALCSRSPSSLPWASQHSTCPPSWRSQAFTFPSNLLSFALPVPSWGRPASYHACDTHTGLPQGL